jgi:hypothetical protein
MMPHLDKRAVGDRLWFQWFKATAVALLMGAPVFWSYPDDRWLMLASAPVFGLLLVPIMRKWRKDEMRARSQGDK